MMANIENIDFVKEIAYLSTVAYPNDQAKHMEPTILLNQMMPWTKYLHAQLLNFIGKKCEMPPMPVAELQKHGEALVDILELTRQLGPKENKEKFADAMDLESWRGVSLHQLIFDRSRMRAKGGYIPKCGDDFQENRKEMIRETEAAIEATRTGVPSVVSGQASSSSGVERGPLGRDGNAEATPMSATEAGPAAAMSVKGEEVTGEGDGCVGAQPPPKAGDKIFNRLRSGSFHREEFHYSFFTLWQFFASFTSFVGKPHPFHSLIEF